MVRALPFARCLVALTLLCLLSLTALQMHVPCTDTVSLRLDLLPLVEPDSDYLFYDCDSDLGGGAVAELIAGCCAGGRSVRMCAPSHKEVFPFPFQMLPNVTRCPQMQSISIYFRILETLNS